MTNTGAESILEKNQLTEEDVVNCVEEVSRFDKRILSSYKDVDKIWQSLNFFTVKRIIELYNKSTVNIKTGEILDFYRDKIHTFECIDVFKSCLDVKYTSSVKDYYDTKMLVVARNNTGDSSIYSKDDILHGIKFIRQNYPNSYDFIQKVEVDFKKVSKDICNIIVFMYVFNKTGPKQIFSSVDLSLETDEGYEIRNINLYKEANSSFGVIGFEFIKGKDHWSAYALKDSISLEFEKFVRSC